MLERSKIFLTLKNIYWKLFGAMYQEWSTKMSRHKWPLLWLDIIFATTCDSPVAGKVPQLKKKKCIKV